MNNRIKPGDLAIVTFRHNSGEIVECIAPLSCEECTQIYLEKTGWELFFPPTETWLISKGLKNRIKGDWFLVPVCEAKWLIPLNGNLLSKEEKNGLEVVA